MNTAPKYRAAIIGVGKASNRTWAKGGGHKIAYDHARALNLIAGVRVTTSADINAENLAAFNAEFQISQGYADYREMLEKEKPDIVGICTYVGLHARMMIDAARAGAKIILCEKPFVSSPAEIQAVRAVVEETGVTLGIAHIRRFNPCFIKARDLVASDTIGDPVILCGGLGGWDLSEFGSHWIDLMRFIRGDMPVNYVMGQARVRDAKGYGHTMEEQAIAYFEFDDGCRGIVDGGRSFAPPDGSGYPERSGWDIRVVGTKGVITITESKELNLINEKGHTIIDASENPDPWEPLYASLITQFEGGAESPVSFARCVPTAEINLGAYLSAVKGDRVDLPLAGSDVAYNRWPLDELAARALTA
jgi:predicted dehydrogenase